MLLHRGGGDSGRADAVGAHDNGLLLPVLVQIRGAERLGVPRAELEDIPDLDDALDGERLAALGAAFTRKRDLEVGPVAREILPRRDTDQVETVAVGADDVGPAPERLVRDNTGDSLQIDRPTEPTDAPRCSRTSSGCAE